MNLNRRLLQQAWGVRMALGLAILAGFSAGIFTVFQARQVSRVISGVFLDGQTLASSLPKLWVLLAILTARALFSFASEIAAGAAAAQIKVQLRDMLVDHLWKIGPVMASGERSGELVNTATQAVEALDAYFSQFLPQLALAGLLPLAYLAVVIPIDPLSGLVLLLTGPLIPIFMFLIGSRSQSLTHRQWAALGRMSAYFLDTLQGLAELKALGRSRDQAGRIVQVSERYRETTLSVLRVTFLSALVLELLGTIGTAIVAVEIGLRLLYGGMQFEPAFFILLLAPEFYMPLRTLGLRFHASQAGVTAAKRIDAILDQPAGLPRPLEPSHPITLREPFVIQFQNVCYTYPGREQPALSGLSFHFSAGEQVALVGPSGAGKTTLAHLLLGFIAPNVGGICVNGVPLAQLDLDSWRAQIAWVPQRPYLFHGTLADNIRLARPQASLSELRQAVEQAQLWEWIERLPAGLDTPVGERGAQISGGQAQRLALARAFLRDAPFLILDEPTAHLDVSLEHQLEATARRLWEGRTVLVIAHRLSTIRQAGRVLVLERGRLVEWGAPGLLAAQNGAFARLMAAGEGQSRSPA